MSDQLLQQLLHEMKEIKTAQQTQNSSIESLKASMEEKFAEVNNNFEDVNIRFDEVNKRFEEVNTKIDKLSDKMDLQHIENVNADNRLMNDLNAIKDSVIFVNRKVADAELEINGLKNRM